jgi:MoaA/NifB/PqqE/SkfB family radical SAM enzyme
LTTTSLAERAKRHLRLCAQAHGLAPLATPPFLIFFINSVCNLKCEHCFVHDRLNKKDDLSFEEIVRLSEDLGRVENLNLSGGEPFLRKEFAAVCTQFIRQNGATKIYVPTNGYYTERTVEAVEAVLQNPELEILALEFSLDGMPRFHNHFRGNPKSFEKAMETYDAVARIQARDPRLHLHAISTATADNVDEIKQLTTYLYERCPQLEHHNLALIRGDRKNPSLRGPQLAGYLELDRYARQLWADREANRFGGIVDPMLTWAKVQTSERRQQVVPCKAGVLSAVVYANGDVGVCETLASHPVLGNLREHSFRQLWHSPQADKARAAIANKQCSCTNEVFLWPSFTFQPAQLARAMIKAKVWEKPEPLPAAARIKIAMDEQRLPIQAPDKQRLPLATAP